jgi:UDP:flavonoid glycosyltransferase YjiC (YdhE family)
LLLVGDKQNLPQTNLPPGVAAFDYAPHSLVMPRASVIVHQGGIGTTGPACEQGGPCLSFRLVRTSQTMRTGVWRLGVAQSVSPRRFTTSRAVRDLPELLDDPDYRERAKRVAQQVQVENGTKTAGDAIEHVLLRAQKSSTSAEPL